LHHRLLPEEESEEQKRPPIDSGGLVVRTRGCELPESADWLLLAERLCDRMLPLSDGGNYT
jgi:hypothetical protein